MIVYARRAIRPVAATCAAKNLVMSAAVRGAIKVFIIAAMERTISLRSGRDVWLCGCELSSLLRDVRNSVYGAWLAITRFEGEMMEEFNGIWFSLGLSLGVAATLCLRKMYDDVHKDDET